MFFFRYVYPFLFGCTVAWFLNQSILWFLRATSAPFIRFASQRLSNRIAIILLHLLLGLPVVIAVSVMIGNVAEFIVTITGASTNSYALGYDLMYLWLLFFGGNDKMKKWIKKGKNEFAKLVDSWNEKARITLAPPTPSLVPVHARASRKEFA